MTGITEVAGESLAKRGTEEVLKQASRIYGALIGKSTILQQDITILCLEQIQHYSIAFEASGGLLGLSKIRFPYGKPIHVKLRPLRGGVDLPEAVSLLEDGFEIITKGMQQHDIFLLDVEYEISDPNYVDSMIQRDHAKELPKEAETEYWMHAALKYPGVLQTKHGRLDLRDVPFTVNVGVSEDIKTSVPKSFKRELDAAGDLLREKDPRRKYVLGIRHSQAMRARSADQGVAELLGELQELFLPDGFSRFVEVKEDFRFGSCNRGLSYYELLPFPTWPKTMTVISRADLGLDRPAAKGIMVYKKKDFLGKVSKILGAEDKSEGT